MRPMRSLLSILCGLLTITPSPASRDFSGSSTANLQDSSAVGTYAGITACAWVYLVSLPVGVSGRVIELDDTGGLIFLLQITTAGEIGMTRGTSATSRSAVGTGALSTSTWYFICGTHDGAGGTPKTYVSSGTGINISVAEHVAYTSTNAGTGTDSSAVPSVVTIGNSFALDRIVSGRIAEVSIYGAVLTTAQMTSLARGYPVAGAQLNVPIYGNVDPEPDTSGIGNSLVVSGAVKAAHAPIAPSFGWWN